MNDARPWLSRCALPFALALTLAPAVAQQGQANYAGPQAVAYVGSLSGGYDFGPTLVRAMNASKYFRALDKPDAADLSISGGVTGARSSGSTCVLFVCVSTTTITANVEVTDLATGEVLAARACEGSSGAASSGWWYGFSVSGSSDAEKAAADCAVKLVGELVNEPKLKPYFKLAQGAPLPPARAAAAPAAAAQAPAPAAAAGALSAEAAVAGANALVAALKTLAFEDLNAALSSDLYNPVRARELKAALTAEQLAAAAAMSFSVAPGEAFAQYTVVTVTYTVPGAGGARVEKQATIAVTGNPSVSTRAGNRVVYLSPLNPGRTGPLDLLSKGVEQIVADVHAALGLAAPR